MASALWIGATGLMASSKQMDVIGNNLANTNTVGFKAGSTLFAAMLSQNLHSGSGNMQVGQGVMTSAIPTQFEQGTMETTGSVLDLAIDGNGFFVVKDNAGAEYYTRAGSFRLDQHGNLVDNLNNYYVQGYNIYPNSPNPNAETTINFQNVQSEPNATTEIKASANLMAQQYDPVNPAVFNLSQNIYDTIGGINSLNLQFTQIATGQWSCEPIVTDPKGGTYYSSTFTVEFDPDGALASVNGTAIPPLISIPINIGAVTFPNGGELAPITWTPGGVGSKLTGFDAPSVVNSTSNDGYGSGTLQYLFVGKDGMISGAFTNGQRMDLAQVILADFPDIYSLQKVGSYFIETMWSGQPIKNSPTTGTMGSIHSNSLEVSNTDVATEFINMIMAQKAYQANARVITTSDQLLTELMNIKR